MQQGQFREGYRIDCHCVTCAVQLWHLLWLMCTSNSFLLAICAFTFYLYLSYIELKLPDSKSKS